MDVRPQPGRLFRLVVGVDPPDVQYIITLASEMGRKTVQSNPATFTGLPPGEYEVYAEGPAPPESGSPVQAAYLRFYLRGDQFVPLSAKPVRQPRFRG